MTRPIQCCETLRFPEPFESFLVRFPQDQRYKIAVIFSMEQARRIKAEEPSIQYLVAFGHWPSPAVVKAVPSTDVPDLQSAYRGCASGPLCGVCKWPGE